MLKILELFGGIGAPRKALVKLGVKHKSIDYVEFNEKAVRSYNAMFDNGYSAQDVRGYDLKPDILIHGSPCQDFSIGGKQYGGNIEDGTRSSLMFETIQIVENLGVWKPKVIIWENVPNVLSKKMFGAFEHYLDELTSLGYKHNYEILNSLDYGTPQKRKRLITVSTLTEKFDFNQIEKTKFDDIQNYLVNDYGRQHLVSQKSMIERLPGSYGYENMTRKLKVIEDYCWTITTKQMRCPNAGVIKLENGNYRYLTELECWRLMGFDDSDYLNALKEHPGKEGKLNGALYHQAGNSMDVNMLMALFKAVLKTNCLDKGI